MIPTLLLFGLISGRWWHLSLIVAAIGWPLLLVATGVMRLSPGLLGAAGLAVSIWASGHLSIRLA